MRIAIITFPGSNCDYDCYQAARHVIGADARYVWHREEALPEPDIVVLPGGFSYGDYLRAGAIARFSPIMNAVSRFAEEGGPVLGICNGFQILCEAGMLPGTLLRNASLKFVGRKVYVRVENDDTMFTSRYRDGQVLALHVAHGMGNYVADPDVISELEADGGVVFRYTDADGHVSDDANPNGATNGIAGVINAAGNVMGLMPHPERSVEALLGSTDGRGIFESLRDHVMGVTSAALTATMGRG